MQYSEFYKKIGFNKELERLEKQASLGFEKEINMLKNLNLKENSDILEVGSGPGFYTKILLDNFNTSQITCLDSDEGFLRVASDKLSGKYGDRVVFAKDDITNSSMPDNYFDYVIARFVFQHLSDPISGLKEIYRVLRPGGKVVIIDVDGGLWGATYPKNDLIYTLHNSLSKIQSSLKGNREIGRILLTLLKKKGFKNLDIQAVINHSDILGKDNFRYKINSNMVSDPKLSKIMEEYNRFFDLENSSIMMLKLFFYGEKPI